MDAKKGLRYWLSASKTGKQVSEYQIKILERININTAEKFVDIDFAQALLALSCTETEEIKREILDLIVPTVTLKTLYQQQPKNYSTGIEELDNLLDSIGQPLRPGRVWELVSKVGVGKTELLYTLALNFVRKYGADHQVLFVDCKFDFDSARLQQIMLEWKLDEPAIDSYLDTINVLQASTAQLVIEGLRSLLDKLSSPKDNSKNVSRIKFVLIDSLSACYSLFRNQHHLNEGRKYLTDLACVIRELAVQHGIAFIVANMIYKRRDNNTLADRTLEDRSPLGEYWCSVGTLALQLEVPAESHNDGVRLLKVLKNSSGVSEGSCTLHITDGGVI